MVVTAGGGTRFADSWRRLAALALALVLLGAAASAQAAAAAPGKGKRSVIFVGNNWEGTADVIEAGGDFERIARVNIIPDIDERMEQMLNPLHPGYDPLRYPYFLLINAMIGEGNHQYVDDMYSSRNGRLLVVSRPSLKDVVGIRLRDGAIKWRFEVEGQRSDHMGLSPDGRHVAVSASTGNVVHVLDVRTGEEVDRWGSGDSPHENTYSEDGERLYHASIGLVYTPLDLPLLDTTKGSRVFQVVDTDGYDVIEQLDMGQELEKAGYPDMSSAVRPMAVARNEKRVYFQVSFFHGFAEYNFKRDRITRVAELPDYTNDLPRELYLLDSAHHGIALSGNERKLCVAGTMSDYAAIVRRRNFERYEILQKGTKPYWSTTSANGKHCYVSWSGSDEVSVLSYAKEREIARIPVGDHPQRVRTGSVRKGWGQTPFINGV